MPAAGFLSKIGARSSFKLVANVQLHTGDYCRVHESGIAIIPYVTVYQTGIGTKLSLCSCLSVQDLEGMFLPRGLDTSQPQTRIDCMSVS